MRLLFAAIVVLGLSRLCVAASPHVDPEAGAHLSAAVESSPHPTPAAEPAWARKVVSGIVAMFLLAMLVGPVVRANMPQEIPVTHSHDELPGASGAHGQGGEIADAHSH